MTSKLLKISIGISLLLCVSLVMLSYFSEVASTPPHLPLERVGLVGTYRVGGGQSLPLNEQTAIDPNGGETVYIRGCFTREIPANQLVMLRVDNIKAALYVNGRLIYCREGEDAYPFYTKADGNLWASFISPGIGPTDVVELELSNPYDNQGILPLTKFLNTIYVGYDGALFQAMFAQNGARLFAALYVVCLGLALLVAACVLLTKRAQHVERCFYLAGFTISAGIWFFIRFDILSFFSRFPHSNNLLDAIGLAMTPIFFIAYLLSFIEGKSRRALLITEYAYIALCLVFLLGIPAGLYDPYMYRNMHILIIGVMAAIVLGCVVYESIWAKDKDARAMILSTLLLCGGTLIDAASYYLFHNPINVAFHIGFIILILIELVKMVRFYIENLQAVAEAEHLKHELLENKVSVMLSQIRPHFLYNALVAIQQLCDEDPQRAEQAVGDFSRYLRGNLDSLTNSHPIPFDKELEHVDHYFALEHMRFGDRMAIAYDIRYRDFTLPALTLQPLVENAVRHGLFRKPGGGTVTVSTYETADNVVVSVSDDGLGFAVGQMRGDRSYVGLDNVKARLQAQCGGSLDVQSAPNQGTTVTIRLSKSKLV